MVSSSSRHCARAAMIAGVCMIMLRALAATASVQLSDDALRAFSTALYQPSQLETPLVSLRSSSYPSLQPRIVMSLNMGDAVQGLPGAQTEPALVRRAPAEEHQGVAVGRAPRPAEAKTPRVLGSAYPRDGGSPSCSTKEGGHDAPTPPKAGPLHQASGGLNTEPLSSTLRLARGGHLEKDSNSGERSQLDVVLAALILVGDQVPPSALGRGCQGKRSAASGRRSPSCVRRTDGEATVAQPGSAPLPELPGAEVARSNRAGGSTPGTVRAVSAIANGVDSDVVSSCVANSSLAYSRQVRTLADAGVVTMAQLGERRAFNPGGAGSTPAGGTTSNRQTVTKILRVHLGIVGRPATVSESLTGTAAAEPAPIVRCT